MTPKHPPCRYPHTTAERASQPDIKTEYSEKKTKKNDYMQISLKLLFLSREGFFKFYKIPADSLRLFYVDFIFDSSFNKRKIVNTNGNCEYKRLYIDANFGRPFPYKLLEIHFYKNLAREE